MLYLPEALCAIHSRAMDQEGVEEHRISGTHLQVDPGSIGIIVPNTMVHFVHATLQNETTNSSVQSEHWLSQHATWGQRARLVQLHTCHLNSVM